LSGKWHLGLTSDSKPIHRGFDETLGFDIIARYLPYGARSAFCSFPDFFDRYLWATIRYEVSKDNGPFFAPKGYLTDYLAEEAGRAIHANKDHPFFMYVALTSMHTPLEALQSDFDAVEALEVVHGYGPDQVPMTHCQKVYGAMLLALDRAVGTILKAVEESGQADNTIVIFTNDNGAPMILPHLNTPHRGGKATLFEGGTRVPLMMRWPALSKSLGSRHVAGSGGTDKGVEVDSMVSHLDIFPTIMEAAGVALGKRSGKTLDGSSLLPLMRDTATGQRGDLKKKGHDSLFWRSGHYMSYHKGDWKVQTSSRPSKHWLYNIAEDPGELNNLAESAEHAGLLQDMLMLMNEENSMHSVSLWPALSETPLLIDKLFHDRYVEGDEYIYWPN
jgi:arylsulfatase A-like enzyme